MQRDEPWGCSASWLVESMKSELYKKCDNLAIKMENKK